ncbi:MAG: beta-N-acetylhexosaminidase [Pseudobdellovibrionaceae bacterium]
MSKMNHNQMTLDQQIGQLFFIGVSGLSLTSDEKKFIVENNISGVTLFGRNLQEPKQIHDLCSEIQSLSKQQSSRSPLFIAIDQEGGRVQRIKDPLTVWPPLAVAGKLDNTAVTFQWMNLLGMELASFGINVNWAPCLDVFSNPRNTVIGDRAISADVAIVEKHASALIRGFIKSGVMSCVKHFPGHGNTLLDSHEDLPVETKSLDELNQLELLPFRKGLRSKADFVMTSHILFKNIDPNFPVTLSRKFLQDILRAEMKFRGLVVSDDLGMKALSKNYEVEDIPVLALNAGVDMLLYCNEFDSPPLAIDALLRAVAQGKIDKQLIEQIYGQVQFTKQEKLNKNLQLPFDLAMKVVTDPRHKDFANSLRRGEIPDLKMFEE